MLTSTRRITLTACLTASLVAGVGAVTPTVATAAPPTVDVDFADRTGPVKHGAGGFLYGLNDEGVPSDNLLEPLALTSAAQAAPFALQHPGGNALDVADQFLRNGGEYVQIYMQEVYAQWPYDSIGDDNGMADYIPKMKRTVEAVLANPHRDSFVYVPFNEPDWIWYSLGEKNDTKYQRNRDRFFADWKTAYTLIKGMHPQARIAGPNESFFNARFLADFFPWAKANNVLPDLMTWHELPTTELASYRDHYNDFRALEKKVGIGPIPIDINEWGGRRDLSVPGRLIQFMSLFEDTKVNAGGQAYWNPSGNLSGSVSQTNKPGGGWWLLKMYADLSGDTVRLTPPQADVVDTMQGIASIDDRKKQAHVVVGGGREDTDVVLRNLEPSMLGKTAHVAVRSTTWSGYDADAPPPAVISEQIVDVRNGAITVPLRGVDELAAYEIVVSPGKGAGISAPSLPWTQKLEAENAQVVSGTVTVQGTPQNWNQPAASNTRDVGSLNKPDSSVTFTTTVPKTGRYNLGILYGNQTGVVSQQVLRIDGASPRFVDYPATLDWVYRARKDVQVDLTAGTHTITLAASDPSIGGARGEATLDRLDVTALPPTGQSMPTAYEAELARASDGSVFTYGNKRQSGAGWVDVSADESLTFDVAVPADGFYDLSTTYSSRPKKAESGASAYVDDRALTGSAFTRSTGSWDDQASRVYLSAGSHRFRIDAGVKGVSVDVLHVSVATEAVPVVQSIEAESPQNIRSGSARIEPSYSAAGGAQVVGVGSGPGNALTLTGVVSTDGGASVLMVHYANDERGRGDAFNHNIITRPVWVSVNGGQPVKTNLRNTWSWENFWSVGIPIDLQPGSNSITLSNPDGPAANFDKFEVAPLTVPVR